MKTVDITSSGNFTRKRFEVWVLARSRDGFPIAPTKASIFRITLVRELSSSLSSSRSQFCPPVSIATWSARQSRVLLSTFPLIKALTRSVLLVLRLGSCSRELVSSKHWERKESFTWRDSVCGNPFAELLSTSIASFSIAVWSASE